MSKLENWLFAIKGVGIALQPSVSPYINGLDLYLSHMTKVVSELILLLWPESTYAFAVFHFFHGKISLALAADFHDGKIVVVLVADKRGLL